MRVVPLGRLSVLERSFLCFSLILGEWMYSCTYKTSWLKLNPRSWDCATSQNIRGQSLLPTNESDPHKRYNTIADANVTLLFTGPWAPEGAFRSENVKESSWTWVQIPCVHRGLVFFFKLKKNFVVVAWSFVFVYRPVGRGETWGTVPRLEIPDRVVFFSFDLLTNEKPE